jgi:hypothetical protein
MTEKKCPKCGKIKKLEMFSRDKSTKSGHRYMCKECDKIKAQAWRVKNPEKKKAADSKWSREHPEKKRDASSRWYYKHPTEAREKYLKRGKLNHSMRAGIYNSLKNNSKARQHWENLVGYTIDQLKRHLEKQFKEGMTWENYGRVWEIDHKIPIAVFNYEKPTDIDFRICWSIKNLQPLTRFENRSKQGKIDKPFQPSLAMAI